MKDDFEKQLQRQRIRPLPPEWRAEILSQATTQAGAEPHPQPEPRTNWWRTLLWPSPIAWGAVAMVWAGILVMNHESGEEPILRVTSRPISPRREAQMAMQEKHRLFAELMREMESDWTREPEKLFVPKPRSEAVRSTACA